MRDSSGARGRATTGHRQTQHRAARRHGHANIPWQAWRRQAARAQRPRPWRQQRPAQQHCAKAGRGQRRRRSAGARSGRHLHRQGGLGAPARRRLAASQPCCEPAAAPAPVRGGAQMRLVPTHGGELGTTREAGSRRAAREAAARGGLAAQGIAGTASGARRWADAAGAGRHAPREHHPRPGRPLDSAPSVTRKFFCSWACGKDANPGNGVA